MDENRTITLSASEPKYFKFVFPESVSNVLLILTSPDDVCMSVSIQNLSVNTHFYLSMSNVCIKISSVLQFQCPVFDLDHDLKYEGIWQTMMNKTGMTISVSIGFSQNFILFDSQENDFFSP